MSYQTDDSKPRQFSIGLVAYGVDGPDSSLVFVRLPSERGRWVLTDRCVVEVPCGCCQAVVGEPCRRGWRGNRGGHGAGTHADRRNTWQRESYQKKHSPQPKLRMRAGDIEATQTDPDSE